MYPVAVPARRLGRGGILISSWECSNNRFRLRKRIFAFPKGRVLSAVEITS